MDYTPQPVPSATVPELRGWLDTEHRRIAQTFTDTRDALTIITDAIGDIESDLAALKPYSASGNRWGVTTFVESDGVMEVGQYMDWHQSDADATDYAARITCSGGHFNFGASNIHASNLMVSAGQAVILNAGVNTMYVATITGSYGSLRIGGANNTYAGLEFAGGWHTPVLMLGTADNQTGFWDSTYGWRILLDGSNRLIIHNNTHGVLYGTWGVDAACTTSTAAASGGANGDIHFRTGASRGLYIKVAGTWELVAS